MKHILTLFRAFFLADTRRSAARQAQDIADGIVPPSRRYDSALVASMQRAAMDGGAQ